MPEKLKNHIILTKNLIFNKKSEKLPKNSEKYPEILGFLPCGPVALWPYCIDVQILCKKKIFVCFDISNNLFIYNKFKYVHNQINWQTNFLMTYIWIIYNATSSKAIIAGPLS